jgi:hypothetical protein
VAQFKAVGENYQVKVYLLVRAEYNSVDASMDVTYAVFLDNFGSGNKGHNDAVIFRDSTGDPIH